VYEPAPEIPPIPEPRRTLPLERLGAAIEVLLSSGFPTQILLIGALQGFGLRLVTADGHLSPRFVFTLSLADAVFVVGLIVLFIRAHRESVRDVLIGDRRLLRECALGLALIPAVFMLVIAIIAVLIVFAPWLHNVPRNPMEDMMRTRADAIVFAIVVMIAGGVREEVQRGFILHRFGRYLGGYWTGVGVYSVLFGLGHFEQGYDAMIATGALGVVWRIVYVRRRSIVAPMTSHAGFNLLQLLKYLAIGR
jgi:membrane protease YdiL (CAAX protease family)